MTNKSRQKLLRNLTWQSLIAIVLGAWTLQVSQADTTPSFEREVLPTLTKLGCNAAECHGAASGRGGFKLSLFGSRPKEDFRSIVYADLGRRLQFNRPEDSLLLKKPTETVDHEGGFIFDIDSQPWRLLVAWIASGANYGEPLDLKRIEVASTKVERNSANARSRDSNAPLSEHTLQVWAVDTQGRRSEVTALAEYLSPDPDHIRVTKAGLVQLSQRGESIVTVRFAGALATVRFSIPLFTAKDQERMFSSSQVARAASLPNPIDNAVLETASKLGVPFPQPASHESQLRRVYLDLLGRIPSPEEYRDFMDDVRPDRWERLVEHLLASDQFNRYWVNQWAQWLRIPSPPQEPQVASATRLWLRQQLADQNDWRSMMRLLLTLRGDSHETGPLGFYRAVRDPRQQAERFTETVFGYRLRCANCHDHPLDRWTQDDYHGLAAIFAQLQYGRVIKDQPLGFVVHPVTQLKADTRLPGESTQQARKLGPQDLADWSLDSGWDQATKHFVARTWFAMTGHALVSPLDDWRVSNPPTHPELVEVLQEEFGKGGYHLRPLLREIVTSQTYRAQKLPPGLASGQASLATHPGRPMTSEVLMDSVSDVTDVWEIHTVEEGARRSVDLSQRVSSTRSLTILGRCIDAGGGSEGEFAGADLDLRAALHWLNGSVINDRLSNSAGWLKQAWEENTNDEELVDRIYVRALTRPPTDKEKQYWLDTLRRTRRLHDDTAGPSQAHWAAVEDLTWSLLASPEFRTIP